MYPEMGKVMKICESTSFSHLEVADLPAIHLEARPEPFSNSEPSTCLSSSAYESAERDRAKCEAPGRFIRNGRLCLVLEEVKISQGAARVGTCA